MKFFLDANIPYSVLKAFKKINLIAIHARDVGLSRASDEEIMDYATKSKSILMLENRKLLIFCFRHPKNPFGFL